MSAVPNVKYATFQQDLQNGHIRISLANGRRFILANGQGPSLTMKEITRELNKLAKTSLNPVLVGKSIVLDLQGQAMLQNASGWTWFKVKVRQLFGNVSLKQNLHLQKLTSLLPSAILTTEQNDFVTDLITKLNELKVKSKEYEKDKAHAEIQFAQQLVNTHPQFSKIQHYSQIQSNRLRDHDNKYRNAERDDESIDKLQANFVASLSEMKKMDNSTRLEILHKIGESHPEIVMDTWARNEKHSMQNKLALMAQIKNLQPFLLKLFKENEYY